MSEIQLHLTLPEINQILDALGNKPYVDVYRLINKIQQQAQVQVQTQSQTLKAASGGNDDSNHESN